MANYATQVSDVSKKSVLIAWAIGVLGTLGFHFFKVGKIKKGLIRLMYGLIAWGICITAVSDPEMFSSDSGTFPVILLFALLFIPSIYDLIRIALGIFRDNIGNAVREK